MREYNHKLYTAFLKIIDNIRKSDNEERLKSCRIMAWTQCMIYRKESDMYDFLDQEILKAEAALPNQFNPVTHDQSK